MIRHDVLPTILFNLIGLGLLVAGWVAVSGRTSFAGGLPFVNLAVAGVLVAGIGNALFLTNQRRTLEDRLRRVRDRIASGVAGQ